MWSWSLGWSKIASEDTSPTKMATAKRRKVAFGTLSEKRENFVSESPANSPQMHLVKIDLHAYLCTSVWGGRVMEFWPRKVSFPWGTWLHNKRVMNKIKLGFSWERKSGEHVPFFFFFFVTWILPLVKSTVNKMIVISTWKVNLPWIIVFIRT